MPLARKQFEQLPVFITTMSRWDGEVSSASLSLAKVLSKTNPVYYIDYPYSWADVWRERNKPTVKRRLPALLWGKKILTHVPGQSPNFIAATPPPVLPIYSLPAGTLYNYCSQKNNFILASLIKKIVKQKGYSNYIFLNSFNPAYLSDIKKYLQPTLSIYHSRDAIEEVPGHGLAKENECVQHYDLAMATGKQLCRNIAKRNNRPVAYFPNGGDIGLFKTALTQSYERPAELKDIHTPIIGYTGAICQRIDYELLVKIANANTDKTIVMVGPRLDKQFTSINLDEIPNIVFTGPKKIDALPAYLRHFDCTIIPFKKNNLTAGIYPLKINEYLAAGKAVVTTNFSEDINGFAHEVFMATSHEEFLQLIPPAISSNSATKQQERLAAATANSWENRLSLFWELSWLSYQQKTGIPITQPQAI
jgi:teichuronic acid biosynthesis glycosyltransferase TuaH